MPASKASHQCPDGGPEATSKNTNDDLQTFPDRLNKALLKILIFGNLLSLVFMGPVPTPALLWTNCLVIIHMVVHGYYKLLDRPSPERTSTASKDRKL